MSVQEPCTFVCTQLNNSRAAYEGNSLTVLEYCVVVFVSLYMLPFKIIPCEYLFQSNRNRFLKVKSRRNCENRNCLMFGFSFNSVKYKSFNRKL